VTDNQIQPATTYGGTHNPSGSGFKRPPKLSLPGGLLAFFTVLSASGFSLDVQAKATIVTFSPPTAQQTFAVRINDSGVIAGDYPDGTSTQGSE
jgi:hypothetical protein